MKRVGILTGGGDVPGLNTVIKAVATRCFAEGIDVLGLRRGWQGITAVETDNPESVARETLPLDAEVVRAIDRTGGTFLHSSRTNPAELTASKLPKHLEGRDWPKTERGNLNVTEAVAKNLESLGVDALVVTGGDDTLGFAAKLGAHGFPVVGVPKTMDNDVPGTDYCLGFSTAVTRSVDAIHALRVPVGSHERVLILELFGRNSGATSLHSGFLADVDRVLVPEVPFDVEKVIAKLSADQDNSPSGYAICVVSEGAHQEGGEIIQTGDPDPYGHKKLGGVGQWLLQEFQSRTGRKGMGQSLGYLMRSGAPDTLDRMVARNFGNMAFELLKGESPRHLVSLRKGCYAVEHLDVLNEGARPLDVARFYDSAEYKPRVHEPAGLPMFLT